MTLLREIMERPRDGAYDAGHHQQRNNQSGRSWVQEIIVLVLTIAIGTGGVWAARQLRAPVESATEARTVLEEQIKDRSAVTEALREDIAELRAEIGELEQVMSSPAEEARSEQAALAGATAGTTAVSGPGVEVNVAEPAHPNTPEEHVLDVDLQIVVNALWASGAEAIAINDRRLAYGTAIRTAGEVILVDLEPVQSPYVVTAIGDPDRLVRSFAETSASEHLRILNSNYRITSSIIQIPHAELAAGNTLRLSYTEPTSPPGLHGTLGEEGDTL